MDHAILLVDDEEQVLRSLKRALGDEDYEIHTATGGNEGLEMIEEHAIKVVVSDERMPGMQGSEMLSILSLRFPSVVRIMLTGQASIEAAMKAVNDGQIYRFLLKPWDDFELKLSIRSALEKYDLEMENRQLLALVRTQELKLKILEKKYPGISQTERDANGGFALPELSDEERARIMDACQVE